MGTPAWEAGLLPVGVLRGEIAGLGLGVGGRLSAGRCDHCSVEVTELPGGQRARPGLVGRNVHRVLLLAPTLLDLLLDAAMFAGVAPPAGIECPPAAADRGVQITPE